MQNLGTATVRAYVTQGGLPNIAKDFQRFNFDIRALNWPVVKNSDEFPPVLIENITDEANAFSVCHLAKRRHFVDNFIKKSDGTTNSSAGSLSWTPISFDQGSSTLSDLPFESILKDIVLRFDDYVLVQPDNYTNDSNYKGPKWVDAALTRKIEPNDCDFLRPYQSNLESAFDKTVCVDEWGDAGEETETTEVETLPRTNYVNQTTVKDGLWWAIESSPFSAESNVPFWIHFKRMESPTSASHETMIVISIATGHPTDWYDILIRNDGRPSIIDYRGNLSEGAISPEGAATSPSDGGTTPEDSGETSSSPPPRPQIDFEEEPSKVLDEQTELEVGVMVIAGRLVVIVNNVKTIYTRVEKNGPNVGGIKECKIPPGKIRIFATNVQACVNLSPMTFAPAGLMAWNLAHLPEGLEYKGVNNDGEFGGSVAALPTEPDSPSTIYGVDCRIFEDNSGAIELPSSRFFKKKGEVSFERQEQEEADETDVYILAMKADDGSWGDYVLPNGRTPFFFRLKGGAEVEGVIKFETRELVDILAASETAEAPDYSHFKKSANITVYNEGGRYDFLRDSQYGISLEWGWVTNDGEEDIIHSKKTFTGIIVSATAVEVAGKEALDLHCEDYMHILSSTPIVNSPFYDGMLAFYALKDLAQRSELTEIINDIDSSLEQPFLRSGYGFTKPAMRFPSKQMILECMTNIAGQFELFLFFDPDGKFHVKKLPGGLYSDTAQEEVSATFVRNPSVAATNVILDEKNIEFSFDQTVSRLSVMTVDRDTRLPILITKSPESYGGQPLILFKRVALRDQPALGGRAAAILWAENAAQRMFRPIRKTSFKTAGGLSNVLPFDFILIDEIEFRLMSLNRGFNAESNDFTNTYNAEWLGGA